MRSENLRNFIGEVPPLLTRIGTAIVTALFIALCLAFYKVPYPFTIEADGIILEENDMGEEMQLRLTVPYRYLSSFREHLEVNATLEGWDDVAITGNIIHYSDTIITVGGENYFHAYSSLKEEFADHNRLQPRMKVNAAIVINNLSLWQRLVQK